jgi:Ca-activated chloride channel homolog
MKTLAAVVLLLAAAGPAAGQGADPRLWPEEQRAFFEDGPGLLLDETQRTAFLALDEAGRTAFIADFLDRDPIPETPENELREGIERRRRLAEQEFLSPLDARAQLLFLQGRPADREVIDCGSAFKPMEIWTYGAAPAARQLIVYQPSPDEPFRLWLPIDSKAALYSEDMLNWLEQWEQMRVGGKRIDRRFCPSSAEVDAVTGVDGVHGRRVASTTRTVHNPLSAEPERVETRDFHWSRPQDRARLLERPASLAAWARSAAATPLPPAPPRLAVERFELDFPHWQGQRLDARAFLSVLPGEEKAFATATTDATSRPRVRISVDGAVEEGDRIFDTFRVRYRLDPTVAATPAALLLEHPLRPGRTFLLRLRIRDEGSGAQALLTRGFQVPEAPVATLKEAVAAASTGTMQPLHIAGKDSLLLLPPLGEVVLGVWRAETLVTGDRIEKVVFLVDGEAQLSRTRPPYSAEVRLSPFPREQIVRVEGYDAAGALVASDELVLNQARGAFRVTIAEPKAGARPPLAGSKATVRAEVVVPEESRLAHVELRVNDVLVSTRTAPPWQWQVDVPSGDTVYAAVTAELEDGTRQEAVRFLRAPENMEHVDVDLVELYTTVTDSQGQIVRGLTAGDFEVREAGKPQKLTKFELVENLPLTLGFVIDTSISMATSLVEAERAASGLLHNIMTPRDRAFAIGFSAQPYLLLPPTDDVEGLSEALETLRAHSRTAIHDALVTGLYYFRSTKGQRALILLTDGDDTASSTPWATALEYAKRSGVAIYCVGLNIPTLDREARNKLSELSTSTGGRVFFIGHADELAGVYSQIEQELRSRYLLAYNSDRPAEDEGFRPVEVKVKHGLKARTARGYYP